MRRAAVLALILALSAGQVFAAVFIVRHAEKTASGSDLSRPLTAAGRKRAEALARVLRSTALRAVYATEYRRTQQTAAPAARQAGLKTTIVKAYDDLPAFAGRLRAEGAVEDVLVVAHSDTIPDLLKDLGVARKIEIGDTDYDNLFVVEPSSDVARLLWLHYGPPNPAAAAKMLR